MSISELISKLTAPADTSEVAKLEAMFPQAVFGLLLSGLPKTESRREIVIGGSGNVTMQVVTIPDGSNMIKACADPELFDVNYPGCINATMPGSELLEMAEKIPNADGIPICSATSFNSFPIYKEGYSRLRMAKPIESPRQWWQFWKPH